MSLFKNLMRNPPSALMLLFVVFLPGSLTAEGLHLSDVFTDNAVLQQGVAVPVWGTTTANTNTSLAFTRNKNKGGVPRANTDFIHTRESPEITNGG